MRSAEFPILEFDGESPAVIDPSNTYKPSNQMPGHCVLCFLKDSLDQFVAEHSHTVITNVQTEAGPHPIYRVDYGGRPVALAPPGIGAPIAAAIMESAVALGARYVISCGSSGVLDSNRQVGHLMVPATAVRDEGTSYHYLPPAREIVCSPAALAAIRTVMRRREVPFEEVKTWTTDAFYRETRDKVISRRKEGCVAVEMECSALFAVGEHRGVPIGSILYAGDDVSGESWDRRRYRSRKDVRRLLLELAIEACLELGSR